MRTTLIAIALLAIASKQGTAQNPTNCDDNLEFTQNAFATNHERADILLRGPNTTQYSYDAYPEVRRIKFPNGDTFAQIKNKSWVKSNDWGETGKKVDQKMANDLNILCSVPTSVFSKPKTNDPSQGGFVWKPISEKKSGNANLFIFERTRENPRVGGNGVYPTFTFIQYPGDQDGQLLLREFSGQINVFNALHKVDIQFEIFIAVNTTTTIIDKSQVKQQTKQNNP